MKDLITVFLVAFIMGCAAWIVTCRIHGQECAKVWRYDKK